MQNTRPFVINYSSTTVYSIIQLFINSGLLLRKAISTNVQSTWCPWREFQIWHFFAVLILPISMKIVSSCRWWPCMKIVSSVDVFTTVPSIFEVKRWKAVTRTSNKLSRKMDLFINSVILYSASKHSPLKMGTETFLHDRFCRASSCGRSRRHELSLWIKLLNFYEISQCS